jgi:hypothetical protein
MSETLACSPAPDWRGTCQCFDHFYFDNEVQGYAILLHLHADSDI